MAGNQIVKGSNDVLIPNSQVGIDYSCMEFFGNLYGIGSRSKGKVNLFHSRIGGNVTIDSLTIKSKSKSQDYEGALNAGMAWIKGDFLIENSNISNLHLDRMLVHGSVALSNNTTSHYDLTGLKADSVKFLSSSSERKPSIMMDSVHTNSLKIRNFKIGNLSCAKLYASSCFLEGCEIEDLDFHDALFDQTLSLAGSSIETLYCERMTINEGNFNKNAYLDLRGTEIIAVDKTTGRLNLYGYYKTNSDTKLPDEMWNILKDCKRVQL